MATLKDLKDKRDSLVLVPTNLAVLVRPWEPNATPITSVMASGSLIDFKAQGYQPLGEIEQKAGVDMSPDVKFSDILGYGSRASRRRIKQSETTNFGVTVQEARKIAYQVALSATDSDVVVDSTTGEFYIKKDSSGDQLYWDVLAIAYDGKAGDEIFPWWWYPKMGVDKPGKKQLQMDDALSEPIALTAFEDDENGLYTFGIAGQGWTDLSVAAGFSGAAAAPYTVTIGGSPTGGTFTLSVGAQTTAAIAYNATASAVQSALAALSTVGTGNVQVTGSAGGPYTVAFDAAVTGTFTGSGASLTPSGSVTISQ